MTQNRPSWIDTWMNVAEVVGNRSLCDARKIGAVVVSADNSYSVPGYNGPPRGFDVPWKTLNTERSGCTAWCPRMKNNVRTVGYSNCVSIHAEANCLIRADYSRIQGGSIFVTSAVCWDCGKLVANSGIANVYMTVDMGTEAHRDPYRTMNFMRNCGLGVYVV